MPTDARERRARYTADYDSWSIDTILATEAMSCVMIHDTYEKFRLCYVNYFNITVFLSCIIKIITSVFSSSTDDNSNRGGSSGGNQYSIPP